MRSLASDECEGAGEAPEPAAAETPGQRRARRFRLRSLWRIDGTVEEVAAIFADPREIAEVWAATTLRVEVLERGDANHVGLVLRLHTKGLLPHSFQFLARIREVEPGRLATIDVKGDFDGHAVIAARQHDDGVELAFDWHVVVRHPWIAPLSRVMPGVFVRNHRWVMARGQSALQLRLVQRRGPVGGTPTHPPPKPSFPHNFRFVRDLYSWRRSVSAWNA